MARGIVCELPTSDEMSETASNPDVDHRVIDSSSGKFG